MHDARFATKLEGNKVRCNLCPHNCVIGEGSTGICKVRKNIGGALKTTVYEKPISVHIDPIEKKPFYHVLPGSRALSVGTVGCNLSCDHCQNWEISTASPSASTPETAIKDIIRAAKREGCESIAYTYNEPTIFYEFMYDTAEQARKEGLLNVMVTNGFINEKPLEELIPLIDAANVDLKSISDEFYRKVCKARLAPVLRSLEILKKKGVWVEVTNLIIPGHNDSEKGIHGLVDWVSEHLGRDTPLHFSRFFPHHNMSDVPPTPIDTLQKAFEIASEKLDFVYLGNIPAKIETRCPSCKKVVPRGQGQCSCGTKIPGIWQHA